jgi:hypothetical protein
MMNFVNAMNALNGRVWLACIVVLVIVLLHLRYRKLAPTGSLLDSINGVHVAILGFVLCLCGIGMALSGHEGFGDKVFLSGASFIGGVGVGRIMSKTEKDPGDSPNAPGPDGPKV